MTVIVDVANVMGARPDGWWRDRAGAAARLAVSVAALAAAGSWPAEGSGAEAGSGAAYVLVLEGQARAASIPSAPGISVVRAPGSGDDAIVSLAGTGDVVVTADRELRRRVEAAGAVVEGPGWLLRQLALLSWRRTRSLSAVWEPMPMMYVVAIVLIILIASVMFVLDRALKAVDRGRRSRKAAERLNAAAAEAWGKEEQRQKDASASKALTSVLPAILDRGPRKVA